MSRYEHALAGLKSFQRDTVDYVTKQMPDKGTRTGQARERALIYLMLAQAWGFGRRQGPKRVLQATTRTLHAFEATIDSLRTERIDPGLQRRFVQQLARIERKHHTRARF